MDSSAQFANGCFADFDSLFCAMLMTTYLDWQLRGFYDGKILALDAPITHIRQLVFLDMEIYRPNVRSIGNHLLQWNPRTPLPNFNYTINPNLLRSITAQEFQRKYPFGTSHFLLTILSYAGINLHLPQSQQMKAILLYPDGTHQVLLNYRTNMIDWLSWMSIKEAKQSVRALFKFLAEAPLAEIVHGLDWLSGQLREMAFTSKDDPCRFNPANEDDLRKANGLWLFFQKVTGWQAPPLPQVKWAVNFDARTSALKARLYSDILRQNPLSFALTSRARHQGFQYTLVPQSLQCLTD